MQIILHNKYGQLGNRVILITHFIKYALDHQHKLDISNFEEYKTLFNERSLKSLEKSGIRFTKLSSIHKFYRTLGYRLGSKISNFIKIWDIRQAFDMQDRTCVLEDNFPSASYVFPDGWLFRSSKLSAHDRPWVQQLFRPNAAIEEKLSAFLKQLDSQKETIGLHIRRGDYKGFLGGKYYFEFDYYLKLIERIQEEFPQTNLIICSDEKLPEEFDKFDQVFVSKSDFVTDLFLLSKCAFIVGVPSTFSLIAAYLGDAKLLHVKGMLEIKKSDFLTIDCI